MQLQAARTNARNTCMHRTRPPPRPHARTHARTHTRDDAEFYAQHVVVALGLLDEFLELVLAGLQPVQFLRVLVHRLREQLRLLVLVDVGSLLEVRAQDLKREQKRWRQ